MAEAVEPPDVMLICGMISAEAALFDEAQERLAANFGPTDVISEVMPFDFTHYYDEQMGSPLQRRFVSFTEPVRPNALVEAKLATNTIEREFTARYATPQIARPINLDPGCVSESKLVLASMKEFSHRIYLARGVWAEVTLMYHKDGWQPLPWTFPDYTSGRYDPFLTEVRSRLRQRMHKESVQ